MRTKICDKMELKCLAILLIVYSTCGIFASAQNTTTDNDEPKDDLSPIEEGMKPLFEMTNGFLGIVQPKDPRNLLEAIGLTDIKALLDGEFDDSKASDLSTYLVHYIGYVVCVAIGLVFIIVMPIVGCCFCCCRCCGKCGGRPTGHKQKDTCWRRCHSFTLALLCVVLLAGVVCAFVTNELLRQQTDPAASEENPTMLESFSTNVDELILYKDRLIIELQKVLVVNLKDSIDEILNILRAAPEEAKNRIDAATNAGAILSTSLSLAISVETLNSSLTAMEKYTTRLQDNGNQLNSDLSAVKQDILDALQGCSTQACNDLKTQVEGLKTDANFTKLDDVTAQLDKIRSVITDDDFKTLVQEAIDEYSKVVEKIENATKDATEDVEKQTNDVKDESDKIYKDFEEMLNDYFNSLNGTKTDILKASDDVKTYGDYRWYACLGISCLLLLILLFYVLGLLFGSCGAPVDDHDNSLCSKGVGANCLMAGVGFTFIFSWILMLILMVMFLVGGLTHTEVCKQIVTLEDSDLIELFDDVLGDLLQNSSIDIKVSQALVNCKKNTALYSAFNLSSIIDLEELTDISKYGIEDALDELKKINVDLSDIDILSQETKDALAKLLNIGVDDIDTQTFTDELSKALTSLDLKELADDVDAAAQTVSGQPRNDLTAAAVELRRIQDDLVVVMQGDVDELDKAVQVFKDTLDGIVGEKTFKEKVEDLTNGLEKAADTLGKNGTTIIGTFISETATEIYKEIEDYLANLGDKITNDVGKCRSVYVAADGLIDTACVDVLYPLNGFWFSVGWFLFFSIPSLIIAVKLVSLYRRDSDYESGDGFEDPNFEAYSGSPAYKDNIPLEDSKSRSNQGYHGNYAYNQGYQNDAYTNNRYGDNNIYQNASPPNPPYHYNNSNRY